MAKVRFDDSLPILAEVVAKHLGGEALRTGTVLRDAAGRLSFFAPSRSSPESCDAAAIELIRRLGPYARADRMVVQASDYGAESIRTDPAGMATWIELGEENYSIRLVDRRIVGLDWLRKPQTESAPPPPRFVFASLKGGVGRSTAIAVAAVHLAGLGRRVLAIDLDLEAPGLGSLMLDRDELPAFGMLDALVENGLSGLDEELFQDLIGSSPLARAGGRIDVVPAIGRRTLDNPGDVLAKLSRAYTEDFRADGVTSTFLDQVQETVGKLADPRRYDVVLIDARAGLHESTASALLGLGAEIFLFGIDEPQTVLGFELLLSHLARLSADRPPLAWAEKITLAQAKAPIDANLRAEFARSFQNLVTKIDRRRAPRQEQTQSNIGEGPADWNDHLPDTEVLPDEWSLSVPVAVLNNPLFHAFDPGRRRDLLEEEVYRTTFGELMDRIVASVESPGSPL